MLDIRKTETDIQREGGLLYSSTARKLDFSLDLGNIGFIMSRLTDLYKDRISSVVRELISNAIDATLRAGHTMPIEVTVPRIEQPSFIVRDFGTGMSLEELEAVYTKYGASTKRDDLSQVGSFGLGAKVPFAYVDQFTIKTVKGGVEITGLLRKTEKFAELVILSERRTDEPSGTTICVPVENRFEFDKFKSAIKMYLENVDVMSVGITTPNSTEIKNLIPKKWSEVDTPELGLLKVAINNEHVIFNHISRMINSSREEQKISLEDYIKEGIVFVLEGYEYVPESNNDSKEIFIKVEPGYFDYISSRESINETDRTKSNMNTLIEAVAEKLPEIVVKRIGVLLEDPDSQVLFKLNDYVALWENNERQLNLSLPLVIEKFQLENTISPEILAIVNNLRDLEDTSITIWNNAAKTSFMTRYRDDYGPTTVKYSDFEQYLNTGYKSNLLLIASGQDNLKIVTNCGTYFDKKQTKVIKEAIKIGNSRFAIVPGELPIDLEVLKKITGRKGITVVDYKVLEEKDRERQAQRRLELKQNRTKADEKIIKWAKLTYHFEKAIPVCTVEELDDDVEIPENSNILIYAYTQKMEAVISAAYDEKFIEDSGSIYYPIYNRPESYYINFDYWNLQTIRKVGEKNNVLLEPNFLGRFTAITKTKLQDEFHIVNPIGWHSLHSFSYRTTPLSERKLIEEYGENAFVLSKLTGEDVDERLKHKFAHLFEDVDLVEKANYIKSFGIKNLDFRVAKEMGWYTLLKLGKVLRVTHNPLGTLKGILQADDELDDIVADNIVMPLTKDKIAEFRQKLNDIHFEILDSILS